MKKHARRKAFTLIELLVVITIIAILAGLAVPGINSAMQKARQTAQVSDARNLGTVMFTFATDHDGRYNYKTQTEEDTTPMQVFQRLNDDKYLTDLGILYASGPGTPASKLKWTGGNLDNNNICYGVAIGANDAASDLMPLVFQINEGIPETMATDVDNEAAGEVTLSDKGIWKDQGVIVMYKGNNAAFVKSNKGKVQLFKPGYEGNDDISFKQPD